MAKRSGIKYLWGPSRALLRKVPESTALLVLSVMTGILSGLAAVLLKLVIHAIQSGLSSLVPETRLPYLVFPGVGMLLSLLIVKYLVRDNIGHGVTKVLQAVSKNESRIKKHNCWSSLVTSALTIGFGGSVGAEAPIVYTGAAIGSNLGRYCGMSYRGMTLLLGCGAAGAVAGIFNAPLAGVLFTLEILLFNLSMSGILPLLLSSISATLVSYLILGQENGPFLAHVAPFAMRNLPYYLLLGVLCGFFALYFIRTTLAMEDKLGKISNAYLRWLVSAVSLGVLIFLFPPLHGEGYDFLTPLLHGAEADFGGGTPLNFFLQYKWAVPVFFLLVLLLKVFSMTFTNAGGGVGGTFGPTLFVGALAGVVVASTLNLIKADTVPVSNFVLVGMAGLMAGVMQAPLTAIFLIAEISGGYALLVPLILTSAVSYGVTRIFERYSIYTKRIAARGELLTHEADQAVLTLMKTDQLVEKDFLPVKIDSTLGELADVIARSERSLFPVLDSRGRYQGYVTLADLRKDMFRTDLYDKRHVYNYVRTAPEYVSPEESMDSVMRKFEKTGAWNLPVVTEDRTYLGYLSKSKIFSAYREFLRDFSQD